MGASGDTLNLPFGDDRHIFSVRGLNREARRLIEQGFGIVWVEGEISNLARPSSGHVYWSLKDAQAQVRCAMFRQHSRALGFQPDNGQQVLARGRVSLYEARGEFQLVVDHLEEAGEGQLRRRFEELKNKLAAEGLFDESRKRPLPRLPRRIGVVTSPSGAAIRDVLTVLRRRFPAVPVLVYPTAVQGEGAGAQISATLALADRRGDCDLLILARGGGSLEDLWAFNEEVVARALARLTTPVIVGVGHEVDFTIADFVADLRAPTPSGAAELAVPDQSEWRARARTLDTRLARTITRALKHDGRELAALSHRLHHAHPGAQLRQRAQRVDELEGRLQHSLRAGLSERRARLAELAATVMGASPRHQLAALEARWRWSRAALAKAMQEIVAARASQLTVAKRALNAVGPLNTLARGYAIVSRQDTGGIITSSTSISAGTGIAIRLARGALDATVDETTPPDDV